MRGIKREFSPKCLSLKLNAKAWGLTVHFKQLCMLIFSLVRFGLKQMGLLPLKVSWLMQFINPN